MDAFQKKVNNVLSAELPVAPLGPYLLIFKHLHPIILHYTWKWTIISRRSLDIE